MNMSRLDAYCFFEILNIINQDVSNSVVEEQFKKYGLLSHPDKINNQKDMARKRFYNICLAYLVLSDVNISAKYIAYRKKALSDLEQCAPPEEELSREIERISAEAMKISDKNFKEFIFFLKTELKIISDLNAQTAMGLYYEYLEVEHDKKTFELYIDPEEIKPRLSLAADILHTYVKIMGFILIVYTIFYIIAYIRL